MCFSLSDGSLSVTQKELESEQHADASLNGVFDVALPTHEVKNDSHCYFLLKGLLMRKGVPHGDEFVGDPVLQVVVPSRLHETVLKRAPDAVHCYIRRLSKVAKARISPLTCLRRYCDSYV